MVNLKHVMANFPTIIYSLINTINFEENCLDSQNTVLVTAILYIYIHTYLVKSCKFHRYNFFVSKCGLLLCISQTIFVYPT